MALGPFRVGDRPAAAIQLDIQNGLEDVSVAGFNSVAVILTDPNGNPVTGLSGSIDGSAVLVEWPTTESALEIEGAYILQVTLIGTDLQETLQPRAFNVLAITNVSSAWATVADVKAATGKQVAEETLVRAQFHVEVLTRVAAVECYPAGTAPTGDQTFPVSKRDLRWLKAAVAYQAGWMESQPDLFDRNDVTNISQDGVGVQYTVSGLTLAPLARRALNNLSWFGSRSVNIGARSRSYADYVEWLDDQGQWKPFSL